ncbi:MAG: hypothetical protein MUE69_33895 [Myxococcota bacterium]|nr:hypothetical protein [Myxococcota bacterium]
MTQIRLTSAVIVAGQHRDKDETLDVPSDVAHNLVARGFAEPVSRQPELTLDAPASVPTPAPSLANAAKTFAEAGEHFARAAALSADPTDPKDVDAKDDDEDHDPPADPDTTRDSSDADKTLLAPAQPGEPATAPEGESSASSSRKRRRR